MELRLDRLLDDLRRRTAEVLAAIDTDPMLLRRRSGERILANASAALYTPQEQHQLYAKGIVYRREPYRLVSLPLIKIYNVGERAVTLADLAGLAAEPGVRLRFLRKVDGSLIQLFRDDGQVWFTTRGMIEGARLRSDEHDEDRVPGFDYLAAARKLAGRLYPRLLDDPAALEGRTLLFELIHPLARKVTNYGERADLILLACFDHRRFAYLGHDDLAALAAAYGLRLVDALSPPGDDLAAQVDALLASLAGTDEEGSVVTFERAGAVIYRVKVKTPDYLQLMRLMAFCTYERTVELIDSRPAVRTWDDLRAVLQEQGRERVPEEILDFYRAHWQRFEQYLHDLAWLGRWAEAEVARIDSAIGGRAGRDPGAYRKAFAARAVQTAHPALLFAALDGRIDAPRLRKIIRDDTEARALRTRLGG